MDEDDREMPIPELRDTSSPQSSSSVAAPTQDKSAMAMPTLQEVEMAPVSSSISDEKLSTKQEVDVSGTSFPREFLLFGFVGSCANAYLLQRCHFIFPFKDLDYHSPMHVPLLQNKNMFDLWYVRLFYFKVWRCGGA